MLFVSARLRVAHTSFLMYIYTLTLIYLHTRIYLYTCIVFLCRVFRTIASGTSIKRPNKNGEAWYFMSGPPSAIFRGTVKPFEWFMRYLRMRYTSVTLTAYLWRANLFLVWFRSTPGVGDHAHLPWDAFQFKQGEKAHLSRGENKVEGEIQFWKPLRARFVHIPNCGAGHLNCVEKCVEVTTVATRLWYFIYLR